MTTVTVELGLRSYDIIIRADSLAELGEAVSGATGARKLAVVTDDNVDPLYVPAVERSLREAGFEVAVFEFPAGEPSKTIATACSLWDDCLQFGLDRTSGIVAVGGGVVGDIAGFVAATVLRGIDFVQVPTTLLADVDSSVGGKTGIDHPLGKNLIGAFHQPKLVWIDPTALGTLDTRNFRAGMAEVIKYGIIRDPELFEFLADQRDAVINLDQQAMEHIIAASCRIKADIVAADERESGLRRILNYGHTIGHAIEALDYRRLLHGEAVSLGMVAATDIARSMGILDPELARRQNELLAAYGLPVSHNIDDLNCDDVIDVMMHDKKAIGGKPRFILPVEIGRVEIFDDVDEDLIRKAITGLRR